MTARPARTRLILAALFAFAGLGIGAGGALAATFCVNPVAGQSCTGTSEPTLQAALTAAASPPVNMQRNTVIVGNPGAPPASGYSYSTANPTTNPVDVIGAGPSATTLTFSGGGPATVLVLTGNASSVSNLSVSIPAATGGTGLVLVGSTARGVLVTSPGPQTASITGVDLVQGSTPSAPVPSLTNSTISFPTTGGGSQTLVVASVGAFFQDDRLAGQNAVAMVLAEASSGFPDSSTVRRVTISDPAFGAASAIGLLVSGQAVAADNLAVSMPGNGMGTVIGVNVQSTSSRDAVLNLNQASFYGDADAATTPNSFAVLEGSSNANRSATTNVRNSIFRNFFYGTNRNANASGAVANVRYDYSDYDVLHRLDSNTGGGSGTTTRGVGDLDDVDPGWPNPAAGNFTLPAGSPVINAGDPAGLNPAIESTTDVLGKPRISGGRRDMGAVEFQFPAPTLAGGGTFSARNGKVALRAVCNEPASDSCAFRITLTGHRGRHRVKVVLTGTVAGGRVGTLTGKFSRSARRSIGKAKRLSLKLTGTATDRGGTVFALSEHVTLKRQKHR